MTQLTEKQKAFTREYIQDFNATQAAIRAGYSSRSAKEIAYDLMKTPKVKEEISNLISEIKDERIATATETLIHLSGILRGQDEEEMVFATKDGDIVKGSRRVIPKDRLKAAELLGKYHKLYVDRHELEEKTVITVDIEGVDFDEDGNLIDSDYRPPTAVERKVKEIEKLAE